MTEKLPDEAAESHGDATGWPGWWSWPPGGDVTPMPGAQFDAIAATDEPDPAPRLVGLMGRPRRFKRATEESR